MSRRSSVGSVDGGGGIGPASEASSVSGDFAPLPPAPRRRPMIDDGGSSVSSFDDGSFNPAPHRPPPEPPPEPHPLANLKSHQGKASIEIQQLYGITDPSFASRQLSRYYQTNNPEPAAREVNQDLREKAIAFAIARCIGIGEDINQDGGEDAAQPNAAKDFADRYFVRLQAGDTVLQAIGYAYSFHHKFNGSPLIPRDDVAPTPENPSPNPDQKNKWKRLAYKEFFAAMILSNSDRFFSEHFLEGADSLDHLAQQYEQSANIADAHAAAHDKPASEFTVSADGIHTMFGKGDKCLSVEVVTQGDDQTKIVYSQPGVVKNAQEAKTFFEGIAKQHLQLMLKTTGDTLEDGEKFSAPIELTNIHPAKFAQQAKDAFEHYFESVIVKQKIPASEPTSPSPQPAPPPAPGRNPDDIAGMLQRMGMNR